PTVSSRQRWVVTAVLACLTGAVLIGQAGSLHTVSSSTQKNEALVTGGFHSTPQPVAYFLTSIKEYSTYYLWRFFVPIKLSVDPDVTIVRILLSDFFFLRLFCPVSQCVFSGFGITNR